MKYTYRCDFILHINGERVSCSVRSNEGLDAFQFGFWIDKSYEFTTGSDCVYWIPPSVITLIAKEAR